MRHPKIFRPLVALTAVLLVFGSLAGCGSVPQESPQVVSQLAEPVYPEMAPYPSPDGEGFEAWRESQRLQYSQSAGYADSFQSFFHAGIPAILGGTPGENAVCSPLNIAMALSMLAEITDGNSRQQILDLLQTSEIADVRKAAGFIWNAHYCADGATSSLLANSVWLDANQTCNADTIQTLADLYYASVYQGRLGSPEMNKALQDWLNKQTDGLLKEQVQGVQMSPETVLALASTILYRAKWSLEFSRENNTQAPFLTPDGEQDATYMNTTLIYGPYFWGEDFSAAYLDLEDGSRMWLVLPDEGLTPGELLANGYALNLILGSFADYENQARIRVNLSVPKFDVVSDMNLKASLMNLGITDVFSPDQADFSTVLPDSAAYLDQVQHAARVAIDEEGVTAAAYTVMMMAGAARPPQDEVDLILNRPFLFVITSRDNLPLFAGIVNQP